MRLVDLDPKFIRRDDSRHFTYVDGIADADGVQFLCPKCFATKGDVGTHSVRCWKPSVPQDTSPTPGRWDMKGTGFDDLTLVAGSSSILLTHGCEAHFFIENGAIRMT